MMTPSSFSRGSHHGYLALQLENEALQVVVTPGAGAKIVSLFDKRAGREWLVTPEQSNPFAAWPYGTAYNSNQCGGWDEMFPTILACTYPAAGPYAGVPLPDHGEAWALPWEELGSPAEGITLELRGRALPYRLQRELALVDDCMTLRYTLENRGPAAFAYLWAAHPQFACDAGATITLPPEVSEVVNVLPIEWGAEFGPAGTRNPWPAFVGGGRSVRQDVVAGTEKRGGRKFYLPPEQRISWGELSQPSGEWLRMTWDADVAPYCGVWIDEGYLNKVSDMAFEPTTGYYDSLDAAMANGRVTTLEAGGQVTWELAVKIGSDDSSAGSA